MGLEARRSEYTPTGGTWHGAITDEETRAPVIELLNDAMHNGWAISWLPGLQSVYVEAIEIEIESAGYIDVTVIGSIHRQYAQVAPSVWGLVVHFSLTSHPPR